MRTFLHWLTVGLMSLVALSAHGQANPKPLPDDWITNRLDLPHTLTVTNLQPAAFEKLHAEAIAGKLRVYWPAGDENTNRTVTVWFSAEDLNHTTVRDWRPLPLELRGRAWETSVPIDNVDVPLAYFVESVTGKTVQQSPLRVCLPRVAGLEEPSRIFWPFLEGFEDDIASWRLMSDNGSTMTLADGGKDGHHSLAVRLPKGQRSVTIATTRVRGWQITEQAANGVQLWLRTMQGNARVRFTFTAQAFSTNQVVAISPEEPVLTPEWQRIDVPFKSLPPFPLPELNLLSLEFISIGPAEFRVDNLEMLGRWQLDKRN